MIRIYTKEAKAAIAAIRPVVLNRAPKPILQCVKLTPMDGALRFTVTDLEQFASVTIAAQVSDNAPVVCVPFDKFSDVFKLRDCPDVVDLELVGDCLFVRADNFAIKIHTQRADEFPPDISGDSVTSGAAFSVSDLFNALDFVRPYIGESGRWAADRVQIRADADGVSIAATDSRIAGVVEFGRPGMNAPALYISESAVKTLRAASKKLPPDAKLHLEVIESIYARFAINNYQLTAKCDGTFPPLAELVTSCDSPQAHTSAQDFYSAAKRASVFCDDTNNGQIKISASPQSAGAYLELSVKSTAGESIINYPTTWNNTPGIVATYDARRLVPILKTFSNFDEISLGLSVTRPLIISAKTPSARYIALLSPQTPDNRPYELPARAENCADTLNASEMYIRDTFARLPFDQMRRFAYDGKATELEIAWMLPTSARDEYQQSIYNAWKSAGEKITVPMSALEIHAREEKERQEKEQAEQAQNGKREPWQMSIVDWRKMSHTFKTSKGKMLYVCPGGGVLYLADKMKKWQAVGIIHRHYVQTARDSGKEIPDNVKAQYPDLFPAMAESENTPAPVETKQDTPTMAEEIPPQAPVSTSNEDPIALLMPRYSHVLDTLEKSGAWHSDLEAIKDSMRRYVLSELRGKSPAPLPGVSAKSPYRRGTWAQTLCTELFYRIGWTRGQASRYYLPDQVATPSDDALSEVKRRLLAKCAENSIDTPIKSERMAA